MRSEQLPLNRHEVDRDALQRSDARGIEELLTRPSTRVLHLIDGEVLTSDATDVFYTGVAGTTSALPTAPIDPQDLLIYLGRDDGGSYFAAVHGASSGVELRQELARRTDDPQGAPDLQQSNLRDIGATMAAKDAALATEALALANWHHTNTFCPRCATELTVTEAGWVRQCPADGSQHFPRTDPAVIMAITDDDDRLLLGHAATWPEGRYSLPAGFVEPGESLEAAVRREVLEETGITVGQADYSASQSWPFPGSLMAGFRGRALTTDVMPDGEEITSAMFVTRDELTQAVNHGQVQLPRSTSIAHHLIAAWFGEELPTSSTF